ncbi:hypothetical protein EMCRGX_G001253 [Ephydatia muelleri]
MWDVYNHVADILLKMEQRRGSMKSLVFSLRDISLPAKKNIFALACRTLERKSVIDRVLESTSLLQKEPQLQYHLALVMVFDLLFGKCRLQCTGSIKRALMKHQAELLAAIAKELPKQQHSQPAHLPRYVRINSIKTSDDEVVSKLFASGFVLVSEQSDVCDKTTFCWDRDIPHLLVFHHSSSELLCNHPLYASSDIILQDKASCFSAFVLSPSPGSTVIDSCAAPGNKTTHLASIMANQGAIFAFDKDKTRLLTLNKMVQNAGAACVTTKLQDFLTVIPSSFPDVEYILVDPSCSGSGIVNRCDFQCEPGIDLRRLEKLSKFQEKILKHALSFPSVKRVLYSTCSVHKEENECVVERVLKEVQDSFELVHALPEWNRRGFPVFEEALKCIRIMPEDQTNGFFVAMFERKKQTSNVDGTVVCGSKVKKTFQAQR